MWFDFDLGNALCSAVKPNLQVLRARFSEITPHAVRTACENLTEPDQRVSDAVDVRQELDLRIGEELGRPPHGLINVVLWDQKWALCRYVQPALDSY